MNVAPIHKGAEAQKEEEEEGEEEGEGWKAGRRSGRMEERLGREKHEWGKHYWVRAENTQ